MDKNEIASVAYRYVSCDGGVPRLEHRPCPVLSGMVHLKQQMLQRKNLAFLVVTAGGNLEMTLTLSSAVNMMAS